MAEQSRSQHVRLLARELLDDIELSRTSAESLILKTTRLARWVGSDDIKSWLKLEMGGYNSSDAISLKYMYKTGRWLDHEKKTGYWGPLAQQEALIAAEKAKLAVLRTPDSSSNYAAIAIGNVTKAMEQAANTITRVSGIRTKVLSLLHQFVSEVYYEQEFEALTESIFERYQTDVDSLVVANCKDILEKIPAVMDRLADGNEESVAQALTTCRRIIEAFADSIYPPSQETVEIGGNTLKLDGSKHQNRINAYVHARTDSHSRKQRIRQNLANLFDRVSTGVHTDVTPEEARALFLNTYLFLGEVLHLPSNAPKP
ncbi:AbiTii domain-containing protein [Hydrogenophaga palleronii]|uniref:AbiTii domain-containing protein n=1 Tax=Hydrogenophaga palleronii TaxID=65655 RepID=UPI00082471AC|nr:hypothetical protein [Hydrogenophaga palleronii]